VHARIKHSLIATDEKKHPQKKLRVLQYNLK
jgi:hypothetical protein